MLITQTEFCFNVHVNIVRDFLCELTCRIQTCIPLLSLYVTLVFNYQKNHFKKLNLFDMYFYMGFCCCMNNQII